MIKNNPQNFAFTITIFLFFNNNQFGFIPNHSTCSRLIVYRYNWFVALENNIVTDVILIDFNKTFDVVSHCLLVHKLALLDVCMPTLSWIQAFLRNRFQTVLLNRVYSK